MPPVSVAALPESARAEAGSAVARPAAVLARTGPPAWLQALPFSLVFVVFFIILFVCCYFIGD